MQYQELLNEKKEDIEDMLNWICINSQNVQCDYKYQDLDDETEKNARANTKVMENCHMKRK